MPLPDIPKPIDEKDKIFGISLHVFCKMIYKLIEQTDDEVDEIALNEKMIEITKLERQLSLN